MVRILLADDHQMARLAVSQIIEQADENWKVCCDISDGQQAVERAAELKPDLAVLDFAMPNLDGITAGQRIRAVSPNTSVLVYTFMVCPQLEALAKGSGLQGIVPKADTKALIAEMRRVLSNSHESAFEDNKSIAQADASARPDAGIRILLADDNERVRPILSRIISEADPSWKICSEVANGQQAVEKAADLKPDLVILDFSMPVLDGIGAGRKIRAMLPDVPVLLYTFVASARIEGAAKAAGIQAVIEKADFLALVKEIRKFAPSSQADPGLRPRPTVKPLKRDDPRRFNSGARSRIA